MRGCHHNRESQFKAVKPGVNQPAGNSAPEKPAAFRGPLCCFHALPFVLCKHLLTHIFVSTIAFLTVNFRASSQDKGICEQTAVLIVALCSAECSLSNICLCDTLGLPRAVGCPSAACPRPSDTHRWDIPRSAGLRPGHPLGGRPLSCLFLGFPPLTPSSLKSPHAQFWALCCQHQHPYVCGDRSTPVSISPPALSSGPSCPPPHLSPVLIYRVGALGCFIWSLRHLWALAMCSSGLWTF